jgi:hypothetical protein
MQEKRHTPRKVADQILEISDQITGKQLGHVVNINNEGFMLLSAEPIVIDAVYQLIMSNPPSSHDEKRDSIKFGAEAVWCTEATQPSSYWSGFHIIDINQEDVQRIDQLILDWQTSSP